MTEHGLLAQALVEDVTTYLNNYYVLIHRNTFRFMVEDHVLCICPNIDVGFREGNIFYRNNAHYPNRGDARWDLMANKTDYCTSISGGFLLLKKVPFKT